MLEIPKEELMKKTGSIFKLAVLAAKRTAQLNDGRKPKTEPGEFKKNQAIALKEIAEGKIHFSEKNRG
ncbi:MAG: DNA-directed RNA polymerase subunit omega [Candidatus Omnitrophica bacterium]|nr:DNA-directed RNA polymerase subunit omega [Candidatus Omnitrophota bacterium]